MAESGFNHDAWWSERATTPDTPGPGFQKIYPKADGFWYKRNSAGVESLLGAGGPGTWLSVAVTGTGGAGFFQAPAQSASPAAPGTDGLVLFPNASSYLAWRIKNGSDTFVRTLAGVLSADRTFTLPDYSGPVLIGGFTTSATAAGTTTLTRASTRVQEFTGTTTQDCVLPDATTLVIGREFLIRNLSTGIVTVKTNGGATLLTLAANQEVLLVCKAVSPAAGTWSSQAISGTGAHVLAGSPTIVTPTIASFANATHTHADAAGGGKLAQVNTHESPDTDASTSSLHHTLGTGATQAAAGDHTHAGGKTLLSAWSNNTIPAGATRYQPALGTSLLATEPGAQTIVPLAGTLRNFNIRTLSTQPAGGSLVLTIRVNGASSAITITIAAGASAGLFSDTVHTASIAANDTVNLQLVNNDPSNPCATITGWTLELDYTVN